MVMQSTPQNQGHGPRPGTDRKGEQNGNENSDLFQYQLLPGITREGTEGTRVLGV